MWDLILCTLSKMFDEFTSINTTLDMNLMALDGRMTRRKLQNARIKFC